MMKPSAHLPVSAAIICKDEETCIATCLLSLAEFSEIVVVDSGSTDRTLTILKEFIDAGFPITVLEMDWKGYAKQKQFALENTSKPWILSIDADEWLDEDLRESLPRLLEADETIAGWRIRRALTLFGSVAPPSSWTRPELILRLVRRGRARFDDSVLVHEGLIADGPTPIAKNGILRHERSLPLYDQMKKEIHYAKLKAEQRIARGRTPKRIKMVVSPLAYFLRIFLINRLFLCGWSGFIHAGTGAIYSFMTEAFHHQLWISQKSSSRKESMGDQ